jgi:DNA-binding MarR family transcriptional regulator
VVTTDVVRIGVAWRELRRGAAMQGLRELLYGSGRGAIDMGQVDTLDLLVQRPAWRMSDLAGALRVDASTATRAVSRLVDAGLVARAPAPHDARVVMAAATARGRRAQQRLAERRRELLVRILRDFDDDDRRRLADLLERLVEGVDRVVAAPVDGQP